ncbi:MAG TPA: hypothetical protein ENN73_01275, partial [Firmicutes bacterium]|nr:hypothetical protein [Bacillota bacterium]
MKKRDIGLIVLVFILIFSIGCNGHKEKAPEPGLKTDILWENTNKMKFLDQPETPKTPEVTTDKKNGYKQSDQEKSDFDKILELQNNGKDFTKEFNAFEKSYPKSPHLEELYHRVIENYYYYSRGPGNKNVIEWSKRYFDKFPDGEYSDSVSSYYNWARGITLEIYTNSSFLPGDEASVFLSVRNLKSVDIDVYKISVSEIKFPFREINPFAFNLTEKNHVKKIHKSVTKDFYGSVPLDKFDAGLYVAVASAEDIKAATIVSVSGLGIISKSDKRRLVLFVMDKVTGQPVNGAEVSAYSGVNKIASGKTDKDGIILLDKKENDKFNNLDFNVAKGEDIAFINVYSYYYSYGGETNLKTYFYADRPVYRPAQKVYFKVILRERLDAMNFTIPSDKEIKLILEKPTGEKIYEKVLKTNEFGSINDSIELEEEAALGWYRYKILDSDGKQLSGYYGINAFRVEEYKKPEFKMTVQPKKSAYVLGDEVEVDVDVKYYFGEAVKGGDVEYRIEYSQLYIP